MTDPEELRDHATRIEAGGIPVLRAAALLREAADQMQGFFDTREMRRVELERLYALEKREYTILGAIQLAAGTIARGDELVTKIRELRQGAERAKRFDDLLNSKRQAREADHD